ncbi:hypothetical protein chiPu_0013730, partial [Chiloscyllium punctatum]|nr:hypothetical protein [Chiloscyllium punctatum]
MIQKIVCDWSGGKKYQQFKFVFPFTAQQLKNGNGKTSLNALIVDFYPEVEDELDSLWQKPEEILFIFDDIDQFHRVAHIADVQESNASEECNFFDFWGACERWDIVKRLIKGELLKGCSVLITSRPWNLACLQRANIKMTVKILGFTIDERQEYIECYFANKQLASQVTEYLKQDEVLQDLSCNPLGCSIICSLFQSHVKLKGLVQKTLHINSVQMLSTFVTAILERSEYDLDQDSLLELGKLAFQGICKNKFVFGLDTIKDYRLQHAKVIPVFLREDWDENLGTIAYTFTYSILQVFIAALMEIRKMSGKDVTRLLTEFRTNTDDRFHTFSRFLVGLALLNPTGQIQVRLGPFHPDTSSCVTDWIKRNVVRCVQSISCGQTQREFLQLLRFLWEFGQMDPIIATLEREKKMVFTLCRFKPHDYVILASILDTVEVLKELNLNTCGVHDIGIQQLGSVLQKCEILRLKSNGFTDDCVETLVSALHVNASIKELDLSNDHNVLEKANRFSERSVLAFCHLRETNTNIREIRLEQSLCISKEQQGQKSADGFNILNNEVEHHLPENLFSKQNHIDNTLNAQGIGIGTDLDEMVEGLNDKCVDAS